MATAFSASTATICPACRTHSAISASTSGAATTSSGQGAGPPARQLDLPSYRLPRVILDALRATGAIDVPGTAVLVPAEDAA